MNDSELVKECLIGRQESQKRLYEHFAPKMLGVCYRYANSREEAEDFLQESFITVFRKLNQYKGDGPLGAWIRKIVVNTSLNGIKARHPFTENLDNISPDLFTDHRSSAEFSSDSDLMEMVQQLATGYKTIFNLYAIEGFSHEEISKLLNIKASTSRSQYMKARKILMQKLNMDEKSPQTDIHHG